MDAQHTKHVTYKLASHFVWCPKDRKKILVGSSSWGSTRGPIIEESSEERKERQSRLVILPEVASTARIAL
jgi:REP element-mobilizing transposase RayT